MRYSTESQRLILRSFTLADSEAYFEMTQDPDIRKYVPNSYGDTLEETQNLIKDYIKGDCVRDFYLVLEEKSTHELIGAIIATTCPFYSQIDMCIMSRADCRRKGYIIEALYAFISTLPKHTKLNFLIEKDNENSLSTVSKLSGIKEVSHLLFPEIQKEHRSFEYVV